jgi:hypothetical protein
VNLFPAVDPIPLPAPVWLFKVLHNLTFTFHLAAVELLLGGLMLAVAFGLFGRRPGAYNMAQTGGMIMHRLPTVMAFLINLGVPPLLFAQVLYGRALYTSSVLIGAYWIAVIFLLMGSYYGLYFSAKRANEQKGWSAPGLAALLLALTVAFIYSNNMTLMLRPQVWADMYRHSPGGVQWNTTDPTLWPRWIFFVLGSFAASGAALMLLAQRKHFDDGLRRFLFRAGGVSLVAGLLVQGICAPLVMSAQPPGVWDAVTQDPISSVSVYLWMGTAGAGMALALLAAFSAKPRAVVAIASSILIFLNTAATVLVRDGVRDVTLRAVGFEVWDRQVVTNWSVVLIFVVLLLGAIGALGYLIRVVAKARRIEEKYA